MIFQLTRNIIKKMKNYFNYRTIFNMIYFSEKIEV